MSVLQECATRVSSKSVSQECPIKVPHKSAPQEYATRVFSKSVPHVCARRVSSKSVLQEWFFNAIEHLLFAFLCSVLLREPLKNAFGFVASIRFCSKTAVSQ